MAHTKTSKFIRLAVMTTALTSLPLVAMAEPWTGFVKEGGDSVLSGDLLNDGGDGVTNIGQSGNLYIGNNPNGLDILKGQAVEIEQTSTSAMFVAKDGSKDSDPTKILGSLKTRLSGGGTGGSVMILDTNGIFFGSDSMIDTGGMIASTGELNNEKLINEHKIELTNFGEGSIVEIASGATISIQNGGLAAFVAPTVVNNGIIKARMGRVEMAGTNTLTTIDMYGDGLVEIALDEENTKRLEAVNNGEIDVDGGVIHMTTGAVEDAVNSVVNMGGVARASSATKVGGKIILGGAKTGTVKVSGKATANGKTGGGHVEAVAQKTVVDQTATVEASAIEIGNGGDIFVLGNEFAAILGRAKAKGGALGGNGGFIELSTNENFTLTGEIDTTAANGETGVFLLDPRDLEIRLGEAGSLESILETLELLDLNYSEDKDFITIHESTIEALSLFTDIVLQARRNITVAENIDIASDGVVTIHNGNDLTITTSNSPYSYKYTYYDFIFPFKHTVTVTEADNAGVIDLTGNSTFGANLEFKTTGNGSITIEGATDNQGASNIILSKLTTKDGDINVSTLNGSITFAGKAESKNGNIRAEASTVNLQNDLHTENGVISGTASTVNVQNDNAEIQDGVDVAAVNATVNVAAGTYAGDILVNKTLTLRGARAGIDARNRTGGETIVEMNSPGFTVTADNTVIDGFEITGGTSGDAGIIIDGADNVTVKNNKIHNISGGTHGDGIWIRNSQNGTLTKNWIYDIADDGVNARGNIAGLNASYNLIENVDHTGLEVYQGKGAVTFANNTIKNADQDGIRIDGSNGSMIRDNVITQNDKANGIILATSSNTTVVDNKVNNAKDAVVVTGGSNNVIDDNDLVSFINTGVFIDGATGTKVTDNYIRSSRNGAIGVSVKGAAETKIGGDGVTLRNRIYDVDTGVQLSGDSYTVIDGNDFRDTEKGVYAFNDGGNATRHLTITDNTFNRGDRAIVLQNAKHVLVGGYRDGNEINNFTIGVKAIGGQDIDIDDNTIRNVDYGIYADGVQELNIEDNAIDGRYVTYGKGDIGIYVANSYSPRIGGYGDGNTVEDFDIGIKLFNTTSAKVDRNTVSEFGLAGIKSWMNQSIDITKNIVTNGSGTGIWNVFSPFANIRDNLVSRIGGTGIADVGGFFNHIRDNVVTYTGADGIRSDGGLFNQINNNYVLLSGRNGISVNNGTGTVMNDNMVAWADNNGILVSDSRFTALEDNYVFGSWGNGIELDNAFATALNGNRSEYNYGAGLYINGSYGTYAADNAFNGNGVGVKISGYDYEGGYEGGYEGEYPVPAYEPEISFAKTASVVPLIYYGSPSDNTVLINNTINNNRFAGVETEGNAVGSVFMAGNDLNANTVGMLLAGGEIDISDLLNPNTINGGETAMRFIGDDVNLVNNTLGSTIFTDQTGNYVELVDGALFNPGTPTLIDGLAASWDGVIPLNSILGSGILPASIRQAIENRIIDFDDNITLGQIIVGLGFDLNEEDVFALNLFSLSPDAGNVNVTFQGMPRFAQPDLASLAQISPAAGGDEGESAENLADLEPAAGGQEGCWANISQAGFDGTVNFSFGTNINSAITDSNCSGQDI